MGAFPRGDLALAKIGDEFLNSWFFLQQRALMVGSGIAAPCLGSLSPVGKWG